MVSPENDPFVLRFLIDVLGQMVSIDTTDRNDAGASMSDEPRKEPKPCEIAAMMRQLQESGDVLDAHERSRIDIMCERWGLVQHPTMFIDAKLATHMVEEYFPWGERTQPLVAESDLASAFMRASLFARTYSFADVPDEVWHELSGVMDGYAEKGVDPKTGEEIMTLPMQDYDSEGFAIPKLDNGLEPASWCDCEQVDHDVRAIAALWGEEDNDHAPAHRLYDTADTVRWGHRRPERGD